MKKIFRKINKALHTFVENASSEMHETAEAGGIIKKYALGHKLTKAERKKIRLQTYDVLKGVGIGVPFILIPGASILLPILIKIAKKHNIQLLPSSFNK